MALAYGKQGTDALQRLLIEVRELGVHIGEANKAAEVTRLQELREKDALAVLALHEAAGGNKGLSSADLLEYTRMAMKRVRAEVRREALEEAAEECRKYAEWYDKADDGLSGHGYRADAAADCAYAIRALIEKEGTDAK